MQAVIRDLVFVCLCVHAKLTRSLKLWAEVAKGLPASVALHLKNKDNLGIEVRASERRCSLAGQEAVAATTPYASY